MRQNKIGKKIQQALEMKHYISALSSLCCNEGEVISLKKSFTGPERISFSSLAISISLHFPVSLNGSTYWQLYLGLADFVLLFGYSARYNIIITLLSHSLYKYLYSMCIIFKMKMTSLLRYYVDLICFKRKDKPLCFPSRLDSLCHEFNFFKRYFRFLDKFFPLNCVSTYLSTSLRPVFPILLSTYIKFQEEYIPL